MKEAAYKAIELIQIEKEEKRIEPSHALFREIYNEIEASSEEVKKALNELIKEERITWGNTLNDKCFELK
jgi:hypothetical protein